MVKIIPAILPKSFAELTETLERLKGIATTVQIDIVDGVFGASTTWQYGEEGVTELPYLDSFDFELDLMVEDALPEVGKWMSAGASRLIVHRKSKNAKEALDSLQHIRGEGKGKVSLGVALGAHDEPEMLGAFEGLYDLVQVMGIDTIGVQGEPPDPHGNAIALIKKLRAIDAERTITVDGGVRMENISLLVNAGANRLVVGSLLLRQENLRDTLRTIVAEANHHDAH